jgi:hypothetical protein
MVFNRKTSIRLDDELLEAPLVRVTERQAFLLQGERGKNVIGLFLLSLILVKGCKAGWPDHVKGIFHCCDQESEPPVRL